jgi:16S rRNA (guanine966-N2)-methyltransferase
MRIIAGRFKGARLRPPKRKTVRPTRDQVREALFSVLGQEVEGARVLDLFAGTGALGLEALSRGAESAVFVERDRKTAAALAETIETFGVRDIASVVNLDAFDAVKKFARASTRFEIVFLDPPYAGRWIERLIVNEKFPSLIVKRGLLVLESDETGRSAEIPGVWSRRFSRTYGGTLIEILARV